MLYVRFIWARYSARNRQSWVDTPDPFVYEFGAYQRPYDIMHGCAIYDGFANFIVAVDLFSKFDDTST